MSSELLTIQEASRWASNYLMRDVTASNISYLIQYGRVKKIGNNGSTCVAKDDLEQYYATYTSSRKTNFKKKLGNDLNWALSFEQYKEAETTKHVHRLHPNVGRRVM